MTTNDHNKYFEEPQAGHLDAKREVAREKRRITYDCFHAVFSESGVRCDRGHFRRFGASGHAIPLLTVLRGRSTTVCVKCADYDDGGER